MQLMELDWEEITLPANDGLVIERVGSRIDEKEDTVHFALIVQPHCSFQCYLCSSNVGSQWVFRGCMWYPIFEQFIFPHLIAALGHFCGRKPSDECMLRSINGCCVLDKPYEDEDIKLFIYMLEASISKGNGSCGVYYAKSEGPERPVVRAMISW